MTRKDAIAPLLVILAVILVLEKPEQHDHTVFHPHVSAPLWAALHAYVLFGVCLGVARVVRRSGPPRV